MLFISFRYTVAHNDINKASVPEFKPKQYFAPTYLHIFSKLSTSLVKTKFPFTRTLLIDFINSFFPPKTFFKSMTSSSYYL